MTVVIGSKWLNKISPHITATVISTMKWRGEKYIIYTVQIRGRKNYLSILPLPEFVEHYRHPDTVGDVP
jgi:hypothetical protein